MRYYFNYSKIAARVLNFVTDCTINLSYAKNDQKSAHVYIKSDYGRFFWSFSRPLVGQNWTCFP